MFKTSLYLNLNSETSKEKILQLIASQEVESKMKGMKELISQLSQGKSYEAITHTVIKDILSVQNNELRRLFYYFLELSIPYMSNSELLLLSNQIRKDLEHPNEFMRGAALRYVSRLNSVEILLNFHKPILDNFSHSISFVRRNAYYCLGTITRRLGIFEDTPDHLYNALQRDSDPNCLCQAFSSLFDLDKQRAVDFAYHVTNERNKELSLAMIDKIRDTDFLLHFLVDENASVRLEASLFLLDSTSEIFILEKAVEGIMADLKENKMYLPVALKKLSKVSSSVNISQHSLTVLEFLDPYDLEVCRSILDFVLSVSATQDFISILNFIVQKSSVYAKMALKSNSINVLILSKLSEFVSKFSIYTPELVDLSLKDACIDNPALSYESLSLIRNILLLGDEKKKLIGHLVENLPKIKFGKIFRTILNILVDFAESSDFRNILDIFMNVMEAIWMEKENVFLIPSISICLTEMFYNINSGEEEDKVKLIALLLTFFKYVKEISPSSTSTIISCIRRLKSNLNKVNYTVEAPRSVPKADVSDPLDFPFLKVQEDEKVEMLNKFVHSREQSESISNVHQLTGLSDPIYVECSVIYSRFEIVLDILMINQTDSYLQNMLFDFGSSPNLKASYVSTPENMKSRSAVTRKLIFKVLDSSNGFINGSVTFKYPNESGEYANQIYTLNFSEIKTYVSDFLEPRVISSESFRELWRKMEWENVYSVKLPSHSPLLDIFNMFQKKLKGCVVDCQDNEDFLVGNISSSTKQNNDIFFNVCMTKDIHFINLECRVRSSKEDIVKSLNDILNEVVKLNKSV